VVRRHAEELASSTTACEEADSKVARLQQALQQLHELAKRQRLQQPPTPAAVAPAAAAASSDAQRPWSQYDLNAFRRLELVAYERRQVPLGDTPMPAHELRERGGDGPMSHWRRGLVGALRDWAAGSSQYALHLLVTLAEKVDLLAALRERLRDKEKDREAETNAVIVNRLKSALDGAKVCASEAQRREFHIMLASVAPPRAAMGDQEGMARRVSERLGVIRGNRSAARGSRPYAFELSQRRRADFDGALEQYDTPLRGSGHGHGQPAPLGGGFRPTRRS
jgi:hypothetical protein